MGQIAVVSQPEPFPRLSTAVEAFFADKDLAPNTRRTYRQALDRMTTDLGGDLPLDQVSTAKVRRVLDQRWGQATPATWNTRITALQSFVRYCQRNEWLHQNPLAPIERRREPRDQTRAIPYDDLEALWSRRDIRLREKTLWRMLYETAARTNEVLALNVEDLDRARKRAAVVGKGGHREVIFWASGTARLLARYIRRRRRGPVFVTLHQPNVIPAARDRCPDTGRGRLSYERACTALREASGGWTLHQLRHSSLTHLGEAGASAMLLQAKSRHRDLRTLSRYTKPGTEAVAALTTHFDNSR